MVHFAAGDAAAAIHGDGEDSTAAVERAAGSSRHPAIPVLTQVAGVLPRQIAVVVRHRLRHHQQVEGCCTNLLGRRRAVGNLHRHGGCAR